MSWCIYIYAQNLFVNELNTVLVSCSLILVLLFYCLWCIATRNLWISQIKFKSELIEGTLYFLNLKSKFKASECVQKLKILPIITDLRLIFCRTWCINICQNVLVRLPMRTVLQLFVNELNTVLVSLLFCTLLLTLYCTVICKKCKTFCVSLIKTIEPQWRD